MKSIQVAPDDLVVSPELSRSGSAKSFEERLRSSIEEVGLAEPLKVAALLDGSYLVIDGTMRLRAIRAIRQQDPERFATVPAYLLDYARRYEIRYQSDIYQDLLPSQLAALVEHLHRSENVLKADIARYIGVSPATLRNYTGLWRLLQRGGLFAKIVDLMDVEVIPSSNPYAWLRLKGPGLRKVLVENFTEGNEPYVWIKNTVESARQGATLRFPIKFVEAVTDALPDEFYQAGHEMRTVKRDLGLRKGIPKQSRPESAIGFYDVVKELPKVSAGSSSSAPASAAPSFPDTFENSTTVPTRSPETVLQPASGSLKDPFENMTNASARSSDRVLRSATQSLHDPFENLTNVSMRSSDPVLQSAAKSLREYLQ